MLRDAQNHVYLSGLVTPLLIDPYFEEALLISISTHPGYQVSSHPEFMKTTAHNKHSHHAD